jgi:hypothetical protein
VQQLLAAIWYDGLPGFRRKTMLEQAMQVIQMSCMFPLHSTMYIMAPESENAKFMKKPFVKFISESASYLIFLSKGKAEFHKSCITHYFDISQWLWVQLHSVSKH